MSASSRPALLGCLALALGLGATACRYVWGFEDLSVGEATDGGADVCASRCAEGGARDAHEESDARA